jgi:DNA-binding transcriptional LysR family regulator
MRDALDLNTVRVYAAVVDEQSFAGASRLLAMPSSNVSRHVAHWSADSAYACWSEAPAICA